MAADSHIKALKEERDSRNLVESRERLCLMCRQKFISSWNGNRICRRCRHLESEFSLDRPVSRGSQQSMPLGRRQLRNLEMQRMKEDGTSTKDIADKFKLSVSTVRDIVKKQ